MTTSAEPHPTEGAECAAVDMSKDFVQPERPNQESATHYMDDRMGDVYRAPALLARGARVRVWWGAERRWYHGSIFEIQTEILRGSRTVTFAVVHYDDGDVGRHH